MTPRTEKKNTATSFVHFGGVSALLGVAWGLAMPGRGRRKRTAASKPARGPSAAEAAHGADAVQLEAEAALAEPFLVQALVAAARRVLQQPRPARPRPGFGPGLPSLPGAGAAAPLLLLVLVPLLVPLRARRLRRSRRRRRRSPAGSLLWELRRRLRLQPDGEQSK